MNEPTYQQKLVYDRLNDSLKTIHDSNQKIDSKATLILTGSLTLTGFICGGKLLLLNGQALGTINSLILICICITSIVLTKICMKIYSPAFSATPGDFDLNELYDKIISVEYNHAFNQAIIDLTYCIQKEIATNNSKSEKLISLIKCLNWQLRFLVVLVFWNGLAFVFGK